MQDNGPREGLYEGQKEGKLLKSSVVSDADFFPNRGVSSCLSYLFRSYCIFFNYLVFFIDLLNNTVYPKEVKYACSIMVQLGV